MRDFNRLTRVVRWLADYLEWLQFCGDFVKPPRTDEIALQHFFSCFQRCKIFFFYFICAACIFFSSNKRLQEFFFQNQPPPLPPIPSRVKWSAPETSFSVNKI